MINIPSEISHYFLSQKQTETLRIFLYYKFIKKVAGDGTFLFEPQRDASDLDISLPTLYRHIRRLKALKVVKRKSQSLLYWKAASWGRAISEVRKHRNPSQLSIGRAESLGHYFEKLRSNKTRSFKFDPVLTLDKNGFSRLIYACYLRESVIKQRYQIKRKLPKSKFRTASKAAIAKMNQTYLSSVTVGSWFESSKSTGHRIKKQAIEVGAIQGSNYVECTGLPAEALNTVQDSIARGFAFLSEDGEVKIQHPTRITLPEQQTSELNILDPDLRDNKSLNYITKELFSEGLCKPVYRTIRFPHWYS